MPFSRILDNTIYPRRALADTRQAYREFCRLSVTPGTTPETPILVIEVKEQHAATAHQITLEAWNYLLDRACQIHFEHST
jgi:hypothetical protein